MLKKFVAVLSSALLAVGLSVIAVAAPAQATHPTVSGTYACNPATGTFDITWKVTGDTSYPNETATITKTSVETTPTLVGQTVKNTSFVTAVQSGVAKGSTYQFKVWVQWTNHSAGDLVTKTGSVTIPSNASCFIQQDDTVDCTAATVYLGAALANGNYINMTIRQNGVEKQTSAYVDIWRDYYGVPNTGSGLALRVQKLDGTTTYLPITVEQKNSGILRYEYSSFITGPFTVTWIQFDGHNWHFGADGATLNCGTLQDATAEISLTEPTCSVGQTVVPGVIANATWGEVVVDENGNYSVTATADEGHQFADGQSTKTFTGTLAGPDETQCEPELECLTNKAVSYTYVAATNSGVIRVVNPDPTKYTNELCEGFWVTATSWKYTSDGVWPQIRDVVQKLPKIVSVGEYPYVAAVECGQGDIYASYTAQPDPTENLYGPNNPFQETFLHSMGFVGPHPTWVQQTPGCNELPVEEPTATAITECGTYGSVIVPENTEFITYTLTGNGTTGLNTVTATAVSPYVLENYPEGGWTFDLGSYTDCELGLTIEYVRDCAVDTTNTWRVYNPGEETVIVTFGPGMQHAATPGYSTFDTLRGPGTLTITWGEAGSGLAPGSASADAGEDYTGEDEPCLTEPDVTTVVGQCEYFADGTAQNRSLEITYDNTGSNVPVTFSLQGFDGAYDRTVAAGDSYTFSAPNVTPAGGSYTVIAAGESFPFTVEPCDEPVKPEPKTRDEVAPVYDCSTAVVTITTTTYTTDWVFDTETAQWVEGEEVAGEPVITTRPMTAEEIAWQVCLQTVTDPEASTCESTADTDLTSWIRVELNQNVEYRIDGVLVTEEFTAVEPGEHTVTATALNGYTLTGATPEPDGWTDTVHTWTFVAEDLAECDPPTLGLVLPEYSSTPLTCEVAGSFTIGAEIGDVTWTVNGVETAPGTYPVTEPGTYTLVAKPTNPEDGFEAEWVDEPKVLQFDFPQGEDCDPPTLAQVLPEYSSTPLTCTAAGSYTIGAEFGDVTWTVNGVETAAGTYSVAGPGTVVLEASPTNDEDSFDSAWVDEPITLAFAQPDGGCIQALALTGAAASVGVIWAAVLVTLTGLGIVLLRRKPAPQE